MKQWRINTKKDKIITVLFCILLVYGIINGLFRNSIMHFMERFMPDKLTIMNQPGGYGTVIAAVLVLTLIWVLYGIYKKKEGKLLLASALAGFAMALAVLGAYYGHGWLLVHQVHTTPSSSAWITYEETSMNLYAGDERLSGLQELAGDLKPVPRNEQERLNGEKHGEWEDQKMIWMRFPHRYFHSYDMILYINADDTIYMHRGSMDTRYYEDNGIIAYLTGMIEKEKHEQ